MIVKQASKRLAAAAFAVAVAGAAFAAAPGKSAGPGKEIGTWYDDSGDGAIKIELCGDKLCGKIVWLKDPLNEKGQPLHDANNPDAKLKTRTICGMPLLGGLTHQEDGSWDSGWVYDPKEGKSYSLAAKLIATDRLEITGYLGMKLLGRSMIWSRAPATLPECTGTPAPSEAKKAPAPAAPKAAAAEPAPQQKPAAPAAAEPKPAAPAAAPTAKAASAPKSAPSKIVGEKLPWSEKR